MHRTLHDLIGTLPRAKKKEKGVEKTMEGE
jgi:hypothetical protein